MERGHAGSSGEQTTGSEWWTDATIYQIYPKSFKDTDGDGVGDLRGVVEKLDYLASLGVDAVWLNPFYASPGVDHGYDVSDFQAIDPQYGTMADFDALLEAAHDHGIRVILDLVVNHTSDEHEWFQQSRRRVDGYEDYYYWRDGRPADEADYDTDDGPEDEVAPNDWGSFFGGPAWTYDEVREQWYLHLFDSRQPDLNWEEKAVREAIYDEAIRFWLEKGVDGFRLDAVVHLSKEPGLPDGGYYQYTNGPRTREFLREMIAVIDEYDDVVTIGEMGGITPDDAEDYADDGVDLIIEMDVMDVTVADPFRLEDLKDAVEYWQTTLANAREATHLMNHDRDRVVSRFGDDGEYRVESAKTLGTFLLTLRGTPIIYQGQEIGMTNTVFETLDEVQDPSTSNAIRGRLEPGEIYEKLSRRRKAELSDGTRANARTPMQWESGPGAGFTDGEPWMRINPNAETVNVAQALDDENSVLHHYRKLVALRERFPTLDSGEFELHDRPHPTVFAYTKSSPDETFLVVMNFSDAGAPVDPSADPSGRRKTRSEGDEDRTEVWFDVPSSLSVEDAELLLGNYPVADWQADDLDMLRFRPWESRIYRLR